jgi:uncharacterized protein
VIDPGIEIVLVLVLVAFVAGYVDAVAGGGGLLTVPALLLAGLPPAEAVATNKLQGTFGVAASSFAFWRAGHVDVRSLYIPMTAAAIGAAIGSALVSHVDPQALEAIVPISLLVIAAYFALAPDLDDPRTHRPGNVPARTAAIAGSVALYDGFLGPGAGSFYLMGLVAFAGSGLIEATAKTKVLNLVSNVVALTVFLMSGHVVVPVGLAMAAGQMSGGWLGASSAMHYKSRLIRPMVVTVSAIMAVQLLLAKVLAD